MYKIKKRILWDGELNNLRFSDKPNICETHHSVLKTRGPMKPYTPLNIVNICNNDLLPTTPHQHLLTHVNIYEFLLPPLISTNPHYALLIPTVPLISTNSDNPHPISIIRT